MKIYQIKYGQKEGVERQEFAASDGAASKRCTELKKDADTVGKPERSAIDIPTNKADLIDWLNKNASYAVPE